MKKLLLFILFCSITLTGLHAQTITWTGAENELYNIPSNWNPEQVPTASNDVIIPTGSTMTINVSASVKSIVVQGYSTVNISNNLSFTNNSSFSTNTIINWSSGSLLGGGTLTNNGTVNLTTAGSRQIRSGTTLKNNGLVTMPAGGHLYLYDASIFDNTTTGVFDIQSDATVNYSGNNAHNFNNSGYLKKSGGTGNAPINCYLTNTGIISIESGTLSMNNRVKTFEGGVYNVAENSQLIFGTQINISETLTGTLNGPITWINTVSVVDAATFNFTGDAGVNWSSGDLIGDGILTNASTINLTTAGSRHIRSGTTLKNNGLVTMPAGGHLFLYDASIFDNTTTGVFDIQSDATVNYSGNDVHNFKNSGLLKKSGGTENAPINCYLTNTGIISIESGTLSMNNREKAFEGGEYNVAESSQLIFGTQINVSETLTGTLSGPITWTNSVSVADAATFNFTGDAGVNWNSGDLIGGGILTNASTINLTTAGSRHIKPSTTLKNNGLVTMPAGGHLYLYDASIFDNTTTGVFDIQSDATVNSSGNNAHNFNNTGLLKKSGGAGNASISCYLTNTGIVSVESGTLTMNNREKTFEGGAYNVAENSQLIFGIQINVSETLTGTLNGPINWANIVSVADAATFSFTGNAGVNWSSGSLLGGGTLTNTSVINLTTAGSRHISGAFTTLANTGTITFPSGGYLYLYDNTNLDNQASGIIDFQSNFTVSHSGSGPFNITNEGLIKKTGGTGVTYIHPLVTNSGIIDVLSGELEFTDTFGLNNTADGVVKGIATIDLPTAAKFTNDGTFAPGGSPGVLTVLGTYMSSSSSVLDIELDGLIQGTEYDLLAITGTDAVFEGTVNVSLGFDAEIGDSFTIATVSGEISTKNLVSPIFADYGCLQYTFDITYPNDKEVLLTVSDKGDVLAPEVLTQNITIHLDEDGNATITPSQIDNGSTDNCSLTEDLIFELDKTEFNCNDIGENNVTLTVTDEAGNSTSETAVVAVEDNLPPTLVIQNITVQLDENGTAAITAEDINNGTTDNCTLSDTLIFELDKSEFTCANLGENTVSITVTDGAGNAASETATVTVEDVLPPTLVVQDITVQLDENGAATITAENIDNGSTDNCSLYEDLVFELDKTEFTCDDIGENTVSVTVEDQNGNSSTASVTVTVTDPLNSCGETPINNNCENAIALQCGDSVPGTTVNATLSGMDNPSCAGGTPADVFYTLNVQEGNEYTVSIIGEDYDAVLVLYSGFCGNLTEIDCADNGFSAGTMESITFTATTTETITIRTYDWSASAGSFTISVECVEVPVCTSPEIALIVQDANGTPINDCINENDQYYVLVELSGGSGNSSYTLYDNNGDILEANLTTTFLAGPYDAGNSVSFTAEGNEDDTCSADSEIVNPVVCDIPCEAPEVLVSVVDASQEPMECVEVDGLYYVLVELSGGSGNSSYTLYDNNGDILEANLTTTFLAGPYDAGTSVSFTAEGNDDDTCSADSEIVNPVICDTPCEAPEVLVSVVDASQEPMDCVEVDGQYYVLVELSGGSGNSSYTLYDNNGDILEANLTTTFLAGPYDVGNSVSFTAEGNEDDTCSADSEIVNPVVCDTPCEAPEVLVSVVDASQEPMDCVEVDGQYYVLVELSGGSGNSSYTLYDSNGTALETNFTTTYLAGPYDAGTSISFTAEGNDDDTCSADSEVVNPEICDTPCEAPEISVSLLDEDQNPTECVDGNCSYYVLVELIGGSGNNSYTLYDSNGTTLETNFTSTYIAGPYNAGTSISFTAEGNDDDTCYAESEVVNPEICDVPCEAPEISVSLLDEDQEPTECVDGNCSYYVLVELTGGSGNSSYTLYDNNGTELETNFTSTYIAGPYNAGTSVSFTAEGNDDDTCSADSEVVNPEICDTPCEAPEISVSLLDEDQNPTDCVDGSCSYYVLVELTGGSGNSSYTLYDNNGTELETNFTSTYIAGPYNAGTSISFTAEGNDDDSCSADSELVDPEFCEEEPCELPYNSNTATCSTYISSIDIAGFGISIGNTDFDFSYTSNSIVTDGYEVIYAPILTIYPGLESEYTLRSGPDGNTDSYYYSLWIDSNQNGCFEADEQIIWSNDVNWGVDVTDVSHTFSTDLAPGTYQARIRNSKNDYPWSEGDGDGEALDFTILVITEAEADLILGVDSQVFTDFVYYPNPVEGQLNLQAGTPIEQVEIYSLLGQQLIQVKPNALETHLDTYGLQTGVYLMNVTIEGNQKSFKIIKK